MLTVASVPSGHVYVRHLDPESGPAVHRLPDPGASRPGTPAGAVRWPPVMLRPEWAAGADFDVFHLHFGFDACSPEELAELVAVLRERGKPLVFTVHELRNPHHATRDLHDAQLDVLVPAADELITLTPGAAAEIASRWGRRPSVLPHPQVVDPHTMGVAQDCRARRGAVPFRVGLHVKSLHPGMDPLRVLPTLVETVRDLPDAVLQVNAHRDVLDDDGRHRDDRLAAYLRSAEERGDVEVHVHDPFADRDLWNHLGSLDVSVLPYRFGTHSGWLEACRDLGTTVVAPSCGYFAQQGPVLGYVHDEESYDAESLERAIRIAHELRPHLGASIEDRWAQRQGVADAHEALYRSLVR